MKKKKQIEKELGNALDTVVDSSMVKYNYDKTKVAKSLRISVYTLKLLLNKRNVK